MNRCHSFTAKAIVYVFAALIAALVAACGGGTVQGGGVSGATGTGASSYIVGGTVTGLSGTGLVLQDNGGDNLTLAANGTFKFATKITNGSTYNVTVWAQPIGQTCSVSTGAGTVSGSNVTNVTVVCSNNSYTVGGSISGLAGSVVLQDNNGDNLTVPASGNFTFVTKVAYASPYSVTVLTQPTGQSCSVASGTGTMGAANVTNVSITCGVGTYTIGGTVGKLNGSMVLQDNGADNLTVAVNGPFTFPTAVAYGNPYNVSILTQPTAQLCAVANGSGTTLANVGTVAVSCANLFGGVQGTALALSATGATPMVSTLAGNYPGADGTGAAARFILPFAVVADGAGNLYVTEYTTIRKIVIATGAVTTLAGQEGALGAVDGTGTAATFNFPYAITTDGNSLYVTDRGNNKIRKITPSSGTLAAMTSANAVVTSLTGVPNTAMLAGAADSATAASVSFSSPYGITTDGAGNLYVADTSNNKIRKIVIATGATSSLTGAPSASVWPGASDSATAASVSFSSPYGITTDGAGNLYVADYFNNKIRKVVIATGATSSLTGAPGLPVAPGAADSATAASVSFNSPWGITTDGAGNLYVADYFNNKIRKVVIATGATSSVTGTANTPGIMGYTDGSAANATFDWPLGIASDGANLYVADNRNNAIRQVAISSGQVSTLAGVQIGANGTGRAASFGATSMITSDGVNLYVTECGPMFPIFGGNFDIRKVVIATGVVSTLAGSPAGGFGSADGIGTAATFGCPTGITTDGSSLYVADNFYNNIRKITPSSGTLSAMTSANAVVTTLAGGGPGAADGIGTSAQFTKPMGITTDGLNLYVADMGNNKIRKITPSSGALSAMTSANAVVTSLTGAANTPVAAGAADGAGAAAQFSGPWSITTDGLNLYVADKGNNKIRKITPSSGTLSAMTSANAVVTSLTGAANTPVAAGAADGAGTAASFTSLSDITTDGFNLYVSDMGNNKIRKVTPSSGTLASMTSANAVVSSVTGNANTTMPVGVADGAGSAARFSWPPSITTDGISLYMLDFYNETIRKIQ